MTTPSAVAVVVVTGAGTRTLIQACDAIAGQTRPPAQIVVGAAHRSAPRGVLQSLESRLGVRVVEAEDAASALSGAVSAARADDVAFIQPGFVPKRTFIERCLGAMDDQRATLVAPELRIETPDGLHWRTWSPADFSFVNTLTNPRATPPAFVATRDVWQRAAALVEPLGTLLFWEQWIRVRNAASSMACVPEALVSLDATNDRIWPQFHRDASSLALYRRVLEQHRPLIEREMAEVLIEKEIFFGVARDEHRDVMARRDEALAELDRLRAAAAHHHAYLAHHGRDAVEWGDLRRTSPLSRNWGYERGGPLDRHHIERFLADRCSDMRGAVLEVQELDFTTTFGGERVTDGVVLDVDDDNSRADLIADLRCAPGLDTDRFDCIVLTQTLHVIDDVRAALNECHRILRPGGVLLATVPASSRVCLEYGDGGDLWRATPDGARAMFAETFGAAQVEVTTFGNVLTNIAFAAGAGRTELSAEELETVDPYHPLLAGVRAQKSLVTSGARHRGVVLLYHRVADAPDRHGLTIETDAFEEQLAWLSSHVNVVPLEDALPRARDGFARPTVAITFDDGYVDNLQIAAPLLKKYGLPATFFVTTRFLHSAGEYWWDVLARSATQLGEEEPQRLHDQFVHATPDERARLLDALQRRAPSVRGDADPRPMFASEIASLAGLHGMTIGAHGVDHLALTDQTDDGMASEVRESRAALETLIGRPVRHFAYPYGAVDDRAANIVRRLVPWALTCEPQALPASFDAARVPRVEITPSRASAFAETLTTMLEMGVTRARRAPATSTEGV